MTYKVVEIELYDILDDEDEPHVKWYITLKKTIREDCTFYTFERKSPSDARSRQSFEVDEKELKVLMRLMKEMMEESE